MNGNHWKVGNSTLAPSKIPEPMATKIGIGDEDGHLYPLCKSVSRYNQGFFLPRSRVRTAYKLTRLVFLSWQRRTAKPSAPIFTINKSNDVVSRKDVPFWGPSRDPADLIRQPDVVGHLKLYCCTFFSNQLFSSVAQTTPIKSLRQVRS